MVYQVYRGAEILLGPGREEPGVRRCSVTSRAEALIKCAHGSLTWQNKAQIKRPTPTKGIAQR